MDDGGARAEAKGRPRGARRALPAAHGGAVHQARHRHVHQHVLTQRGPLAGAGGAEGTRAAGGQRRRPPRVRSPRALDPRRHRRAWRGGRGHRRRRRVHPRGRHEQQRGGPGARTRVASPG